MNTAQIKEMIIKTLGITAENLADTMDGTMEKKIRPLVNTLSWDDVAGVLKSATRWQMRNAIDSGDSNMPGEQFAKVIVTRVLVMEIDAHFGVR